MRAVTGAFFLKILFIVLGVGIVLLYTLYQSRSLIEGPQIVILSPRDGSSVAERVVEVRGNTSRVARIFFNDSPIFVDDKGNFKELFALSKGYNIVKVSATDKFGRVKEKTLRLILNSDI
ncbi:MAG: hypothetical protein AAB587_02730 [Patescibacteria group bacterium]